MGKTPGKNSFEDHFKLHSSTDEWNSPLLLDMAKFRSESAPATRYAAMIAAVNMAAVIHRPSRLLLCLGIEFLLSV
jgi:hypothetical protein